MMFWLDVGGAFGQKSRTAKASERSLRPFKHNDNQWQALADGITYDSSDFEFVDASTQTPTEPGGISKKSGKSQKTSKTWPLGNNRGIVIPPPPAASKGKKGKSPKIGKSQKCTKSKKVGKSKKTPKSKGGLSKKCDKKGKGNKKGPASKDYFISQAPSQPGKSRGLNETPLDGIC